MFFVSYSSADGLGGYVQRLFNDLDQKVAQLLGLGATCGAFLDKRSIRAGDDWENVISTGLKRTKVFVCVYSPNYFGIQSPEPNYCAKELFAFLRRYSRSPFVDADGARRLIDPQNLFPILWIGAPDLAKMGMPPPILKALQYQLCGLDNPKLADKYLKDGLEPLLRSNKTAYRTIVTEIGRQIRDRIRFGNPPPEVNELAWAESEDSFYLEKALQPVSPAMSSAGHDAILASLDHNLGPQQVVLLTFDADDLSQPMKIAQSLCEIAASAGYVAKALAFDRKAENVADDLCRTLAEANKANWSVVVLVDSNSDRQWSAPFVKAALEKSSWPAGLLVRGGEYPAGWQNTMRDLLPAGGGTLCSRQIADDSAKTLRLEFLGLLEDLAQKIVASGHIYRPRPDNDGPERRPTLVNTSGKPDA